MISSNVFHTIESNGEDLLVYIFDETTDISKEIEETYLKNRDYYILKSDIVEKIKTIWNDKPKILFKMSSLIYLAEN